jgi:hypothetical protein
MLLKRSLILGLLVLSACAYSDGPFEQVEGRFFDDRLLPKIQDGVSTEGEITALFGAPGKETASESGARQLEYHSVRRRESVSTRFFVRRVHTQTLTQDLGVEIVGGRVTRHSYSARTDENDR